jgi:paraquat-inducible protein B
MTSVKIEKKRGISPVWILPLLALCIGGWLLYKGIRDAGVDITVRFSDSKGITAGKTPVKFRGNVVGVVKDIELRKDFQGVHLKIEMNKNAKPYLVEDLKFWVEEANIEAGRITGLDTLLSGSYIGVQPGTSTKPARFFVGLPSRPALPKTAPGLHISLRADALRSVQVGSGIYHKNILVGEVQEYALQEDESILIAVLIDPRYEGLVNTNTRFWNASGIKLSGGITDLSLDIESIVTLIRGGIVMDTPSAAKEGLAVEDGHLFSLYKDFEAAAYGIPFTLKFTARQNINEGSTRVMYRGMKVGVVQDITLNHDQAHTVTAHVLLDPRAERILRQGTVFYLVKPEVSLKGIRNLDTLITGAHISFVPGSGAYQDHFVVADDATPFQAPFGRRFVLVSDNPGSLEIGAPVYLKKFRIGEVTDFALEDDARRVNIGIVVYDKYKQYIRPNTIFWNTSGINLNADLSGVKVDMESVVSILKGGINILNPPGIKSKTSEPAENGRRFVLHESYEAAVKVIPALQPKGLPVKLTADNLGSLRAGSPILHKKIPVGEITGYRLREKEGDILITAFIEDRYASLVRSTSRFYVVSGIGVQADLSGIKFQTGSLESIVSGGIAFHTPAPGSKARPKRVYELYSDVDAAKNADRISITLNFEENVGLVKGTAVKYQNIQIGEVTDIQFNENMTGVIVKAMLDTKTRGLLTNGTRFWLVHPEISLRGGTHIDTLLTGPFISLSPGKGDFRDVFTALTSKPAVLDTRSGLNVVLESKEQFSIRNGSLVYYRRFPVGTVTDVQLSPTFDKVLIHVHVEEVYRAIVRDNTKFWNVSGVNVKGGVLSGWKVSTESVESLLTGGIALATPNEDQMGSPALEGQHFALYEDAEDSWREWSPSIID